MGFWARFLLHPDEPLPQDVQAVLDTAALLDITEFQVFQMAFFDWYGREATKQTIERYFVPYMFQEQVPPFVRQFARAKLQLAHDGWVDEGPLTRRFKKTGLRNLRRGLGEVLLLVAVLAGLLSLANFFTAGAGCYFPPCY